MNKDKILLLILSVACFAIAYNLYPSANIPDGMHKDPSTGEAMLLNKIKISELQSSPFDSWFNKEFEEYQLDSELLLAIEDFDNVKVEVFLGTWCKDSRREVPRAKKIFDNLGLNENQITWVCVNRDKISPDGLEQNKQINYVPTFIFSKNNVEIGRIVESPSSQTASLESDIFEISLGIPPAPNYSNQ